MTLANTERDLFLDLAYGELHRALRMLRRFPREHLDDRGPDCGHTGRELAQEFLERARVIEGAVRPSFRRLVGPIVIQEDLTGALEGILASSLTLLSSYDALQWNDTVPGEFPGERARRAELLWLGLRDFRRHEEHFAIHLRAALQAAPERGRPVSKSA